jgi:hypothetical protein
MSSRHHTRYAKPCALWPSYTGHRAGGRRRHGSLVQVGSEDKSRKSMKKVWRTLNGPYGPQLCPDYALWLLLATATSSPDKGQTLTCFRRTSAVSPIRTNITQMKAQSVAVKEAAVLPERTQLLLLITTTGTIIQRATKLCASRYESHCPPREMALSESRGEALLG